MMHEIVTPSRLAVLGIFAIVALAVAGQIHTAQAAAIPASGEVQLVSPNYQPGLVPFGAICIAVGIIIGSMATPSREVE